MIQTTRMTKSMADGFTLIEILIVIVIISIVSGIALVTISSNKTKQLENFAKQLTHLITLAEEEAMLRPATLGLAFNTHGFQFLKYTPANDTENPWQAVNTKPLGLREFPENIQIILKVNKERAALDDKPHIIISESGDITPFTLTLATTGDKPCYVVKGEANGKILVELFHEE